MTFLSRKRGSGDSLVSENVVGIIHFTLTFLTSILLTSCVLGFSHGIFVFFRIMISLLGSGTSPRNVSDDRSRHGCISTICARCRIYTRFFYPFKYHN